MTTGPGCPMGNTPTEFEMLSNLVGFLAGVGNTARLISIAVENFARRGEHHVPILTEIHRVCGGLSQTEAVEHARKGIGLPGYEIGEIGSIFSYENLMELHYLRCFLTECLRF